MRRGQVALEFITTYGWAFLIIMIMIGAITYFGVLNPKIFAPDRCDVSAEFICQDFALRAESAESRSEVELKLQNNLGERIDVGRVSFRYQDTESNQLCGGWAAGPGEPNGIGTSANPGTYTLGPGEAGYVNCNGGAGESVFLPAGERVVVSFAFNYTLAGRTLQHTVEGEVFGTVEE